MDSARLRGAQVSREGPALSLSLVKAVPSSANFEQSTRNEQPLRKLAAMDRIYLIIVCASIVLLTIAVGSARQAGNVENGARSALLRIVPR